MNTRHRRNAASTQAAKAGWLCNRCMFFERQSRVCVFQIQLKEWVGEIGVM